MYLVKCGGARDHRARFGERREDRHQVVALERRNLDVREGERRAVDRLGVVVVVVPEAAPKAVARSPTARGCTRPGSRVKVVGKPRCMRDAARVSIRATRGRV